MGGVHVTVIEAGLWVCSYCGKTNIQHMDDINPYDEEGNGADCDHCKKTNHVNGLDLD